MVLAGATDLWQPVDSGIAQVIKQLTGAAFRDWFDIEQNTDRWFANLQIANWKVFTSEEKYQQTRWRAFQCTGCLLTVDGSDDHLVTPEGLPAYDVPPPSLLDPSEETPSANKGTELSSNGREDSDIDIDIVDFLCNEEHIDNDLDVIVENLVFV